ncbi:MAG: ATP-binding protein [Kangiellaceae bacterium]|jgi:anti-sigma regulatory factor (Ser/Thr protein kinase)
MSLPFCITIEPNVEEINRVNSEIFEHLRICGFDDEVTFQTTLCIIEALNNIVEHTDVDGSTAQNTITIESLFVKNILFIKISHQAPAYEVVVPSQEDLLATSGRGWSIMNNWLDIVSYQHKEGENTLLMVKRPQ